MTNTTTPHDEREKYIPLIKDAALWLFRKYYRVRWFASFEPGPPTKPNPLSRYGASGVEDFEAELWIYAIKNDLFRRAEESPKPTEKYLRSAFHNCIKRAVGNGLTRKRILDDSASQEVIYQRISRYEQSLYQIAAEDEDDQTGILDGPGSYKDEMDAARMRHDDGTSISPTSNYWRGLSKEMNEDIKPKEIDERLLSWV